MTRRPFELLVRCEVCPSVERIPMLAADASGIARAVAGAQVVEEALHGHEVEIGFELMRAGSVAGSLDVQPFGRITRIA